MSAQEQERALAQQEAVAFAGAVVEAEDRKRVGGCRDFFVDCVGHCRACNEGYKLSLLGF